MDETIRFNLSGLEGVSKEKFTPKEVLIVISILGVKAMRGIVSRSRAVSNLEGAPRDFFEGA